MKIKLLAVAAFLAVPATAFAQETAPEAECCCKKHEQEGAGCCPEAMQGDEAHAGHSAPAN